MKLDDYFEIGFIHKPHGLKGAVSIQLDVDDPSKYINMESVVVLVDNGLVPFFISSLQISGKKGIMTLEDVTSIEQAIELKSCPIFLPIELLPPLKDGQFYYHDILGFTIIDEQKGKLGVIENIFTEGNQDLISMKFKGKEVLIPITDDIVIKALHEQKEVLVRLPEGLLEIYL